MTLPMDRLQADLAAMIHTVEGNVHAGLHPTKEQLIAFVTSMSAAISRDTASLPPRILEICSNDFSLMG